MSNALMRAASFLLALFATAGLATAQGPKGRGEYELLVELADQGKWDRAVPLAERLTRENPHHPFSWLARGWGAKSTKRYDEGIAAFKKALELGAWRAGNVWHEIAMCEVGKGDTKAALASLERALATGYRSRARLWGNPAFASLKSDPAFRELTRQPVTDGWSREKKWEYDIRLYVEEVHRMHPRPNGVRSRAEWDAEAERIISDLKRLSDDEVVLRLRRLCADLRDGHSHVTADYEKDDAQRLPVLFGAFEEGVFITAVSAGQEDLLWAEVVSVEGKPFAEVFEALKQITPRDNDYRTGNATPPLLRTPRLLKSMGMTASGDALRLGIQDRTGARREVTLRTAPPVSAWVRETAGVVLPPFAKRRSDLYWFEERPELGAVYLQYNGVADKDEESTESFAGRLDRYLKEKGTDRLILDMRWNGGGNQGLTYPLFDAIAMNPKINRPGGLYVIVGRHTFSAALVFLSRLEQFTNAILVGEPTGSGPKFVGENNTIVLPCTGLEVGISDLYWQLGPAWDNRVSYAPHIFVPYRASDMRDGRDAALEAIRHTLSLH